ncbi:MAG: prolyl oligopeptidase family serine peptidase [bacterium]|nr:prolyl oligopeptidase family serine peptidase [bacterium]
MSLSPYRFKQVISFQDQHYALVESPDCDFIYRVSGLSKRWKLDFRVQKLVRSGSCLVLLPSENFCKSYQLLFEDEISERKIMKKSFLLGDGYIIQRSSVAGGYTISDKPIDYSRKFSLDEESELLLPNKIHLFDIVMMRDGIVFTSSSTGIWEASLKAYWQTESQIWKEVKFPSSQHCKNHFIRWLGENQVLVASDKRAQYQRLFNWNVLSNDVKPVSSPSRDHILFQDSQCFLSNHKGYCELVAANDIYKTGYCKDFCKSEHLLTLIADAPASNQRLCSVQLSENSNNDSRLNIISKGLTIDLSGELVTSDNYDFDYTEENLDKGLMLRFKPTFKALGTVVFVHGGPGLCEGHRMRENVIELVDHGFEVISFDASGSAGFGRKFRNRLNGKHGSLDLSELELILRHKVNHFPIFLYGESYGGYLVLKAGIELSNLIRGVINYYGVTDWFDAMLDFKNLTGPLKRRMYKNFGNPNTEVGRDYLNQISILPEAKKLTIPIFTIHGSEDKSVPLSHSEKLYKAMSNAHSLSRLLILPGEGHEIRKYSNRKKAIKEVLNFLKKCLKSDF